VDRGGGEEVLRVKMEGTRNQESRTVKKNQIEKKKKKRDALCHGA
jgi:hypothetical protein